jgi:hypothetical protein
VTRADVLASALDVPPDVRLDGVAIVKKATESPQRQANRPIKVRELLKPDRHAEFFFMDRISDERLILVLFGNARQRISMALL